MSLFAVDAKSFLNYCTSIDNIELSNVFAVISVILIFLLLPW